jgi:hypothetical protein
MPVRSRHQDSLAPQLEEVRELTKKRAAAPLDRLLQLLRGDAQGDSSGARELRRDVYWALSWIETAEVAALLLSALAQESDELASSIAYVMWRQDAVMASLQQRIDEALAAGDETFAGRLLAALVLGDDRGEHRRWVVTHHADLLGRIALDEDDLPAAYPRRRKKR